MTKQMKKEQKKLHQINRELVKLDKKLQKLETGMAGSPQNFAITKQTDKEDNTDV